MLINPGTKLAGLCAKLARFIAQSLTITSRPDSRRDQYGQQSEASVVSELRHEVRLYHLTSE